MRVNVAAAMAATAVGLCVSAPAMAQDAGAAGPNGLYGSLGWSHVGAQGADTESITGRATGRFARYFGVEADVTAGLSGGDKTFAPGTPGQLDVGVKQKLEGAGYVVGFLPIMPRFDLLARVGYGASSYKISPAGLPSYTADEHGVRYGAGAQYLLTGSNGLRVDWTREQMSSLSDSAGFFSSRDKADVWTVSLVHKF